MPAADPQSHPTDDQTREAKNVDDKDLKPSLRPSTDRKADEPDRCDTGQHEPDDGAISIGS